MSQQPPMAAPAPDQAQGIGPAGIRNAEPVARPRPEYEMLGLGMRRSA
ncbi:hypothetical protein [Pelagibacterium lentulum]|nr:hypothetical protein [Pelagibacterium lentulum]